MIAPRRSSGVPQRSVRPLRGCVVLAAMLVTLTACGSTRQARIESTFGDLVPNPALAVSYRIYRGDTGESATLAEVARASRDADVIAFGEHHYSAVCNAVSTELFQELLIQERPVALTMEFLTRDQQSSIDDYLAGAIDESAFQEATGKKSRYWLSHRPLIELARRTDTPVIGAGIARAKWSQWRLSEIEDYDDWLATLTEEERRSFPRECERLRDAYWDAIKAFRHGEPEDEEPPTEEELAEIEAQQWAFFTTQSLWDDSFAEAMADARAENPALRTYLVVGAFHIHNGLGTITKYERRRPDDRILTISMSPNSREGYDLSFNEDDLGLADYVLYTVVAPAPAAASPATTDDDDEADDDADESDDGDEAGEDDSTSS